ncbi:MAG TPA: thioredoxin domain-containing protein [Steroidobacteraceae bacterium]|jgi:uncharacterized protein YyaL (SSP411 family)|nr:thioredoxin domain-containing protein [Steroidobacteraceae bacterium]
MNQLEHQSSPYLRQHAHNPVDWHPWGAAALERARRERKPILLSIGYAACHWCHVMAHESFEDPATAELMNALYVNVKVDREQRPDLDRIYQQSQQMLTGRAGGWPLTMFLMHDNQRPFFGGTYFPREARFGLPAFRDLLQQVSGYYHSHLDQLRSSAAQLTAALAQTSAANGTDAALDAAPLRTGRERLRRSFDEQNGGFGSAPKFPHTPGLTLLLRDWQAGASEPERAKSERHMLELSLRAMAEGGMFDQLGGGFFRYAVDQRWQIPHFEKMLYDNALLLRLYAEAALALGQRPLAETATAVADWMLREFGNGQGALYSSLDADSDGHEGRFYVWQRDEVQRALESHEWAVFAMRFGLNSAPNFEDQWHLHVAASVEQIAAARQLSLEQVRAALAAARRKLLQLRVARLRPALDDKVLCSWNALAITGLAVAARCLGRDDYAVAADAALAYLRRVHWQNGRLLASSVRNEAQFPAYLDDHAFLLEAILELQTLRFRLEELQWAIDLAEVLLRHFEDRRAGGFFFTADDHEALISRPKSFGDESVPAGNAVAARALLRLGYLLGEPRYLVAAERALRAAWPELHANPESQASMLQALQEYLEPPQIVLLRGRPGAIEPWQTALNAVYAPCRWTVAIAAGIAGLPEAIAAKQAGDSALAYVCRGSVCGMPIDSLTALLRELNIQSG